MNTDFGVTNTNLLPARGNPADFYVFVRDVVMYDCEVSSIGALPVQYTRRFPEMQVPLLGLHYWHSLWQY